jgi:hypothetical protein
VGACDGSNAFQPVKTPPQIVELSAPAQVDEGAAFEVNTRAVGLVRIDSIVVTFEGAITGRQVESNTRPISDLRAEFDFTAPDPTFQNIATYTAIAVDAQGNVSLPRTGTILIRDLTPPGPVTLTVDPTTVFQDQIVNFGVTAADNLLLTRVGVTVRDPGGLVVFADSSVANAASASASFDWDVGTEPEFGTYTAVAFAVDAEGNRNTSETVEFEVEFEDTLPPMVEILTPGVGSAVPLFDSILVRVRVTDNDQVDSIRFEGFSVRGDADLGTEQIRQRFPAVVVGPSALAGTSDTTIARWIKHRVPAGSTVTHSGSTLLPGDSVSEQLVVRVTAWDRQNTEGPGVATTTVQLHGDVTPPSVVILQPTDGLTYGHQSQIAVRAQVRDDSGFNRKGVERVTFRAFVRRPDPVTAELRDVTLAQVDTTFFGPQRIIAPQEILKALGPIASDTVPRQVYIEVTAWDGWWRFDQPPIVTQSNTLQWARQIGADTIVITVMPPPPPPP